MSPQECKIARCTENQFEVKPDSLHWLQRHPAIHIIHNKWLDFLLATPEIPSDTYLKSRGTPISAQQLEESSVHHISSRDES